MSRDDPQHLGRTIAVAAALVFALAFGVIVLASGDWLPGTIIVVSAAIGLAARAPVILRAWRERRPPSPTA